MRPGLKAVFKDYLLNSSFHGLRFIADDELHWTERIFWFICVLLSWYGSIMLILASIEAFIYNAISFGTETTYKDWDTHFVSVAVCENPNDPKIYDVSDSIWTLEHAIDLEEVLKELAYFRGFSYYALQYCNKPKVDPMCPLNNFSYYANLVRSSCKESISHCSFNGVPFECCPKFKQIQTDIGLCLIINSEQVETEDEEIEMISNRRDGTGKLAFRVHIPATIYTTGDDEVPSLTTMQANLFSVSDPFLYRRHIAVRNIDNDPSLREISPENRHCRYGDENYLDVYPKYSRSACIVQCRKDSQRRVCNCTDHFMPNTRPEEHCNMTGLECLNRNNGDLSVLKPPWAKRKGLVCECPQSCTEDDLTIIKDEKLRSESGNIEVEVQLDYLPSERYKRNVVRKKIDLVVSTGGTTGLFVGASLLSFVELFYYLTIRYYGTVYMEKKIIKEKDKVKLNPENSGEKTAVVKFLSDKRRNPIIDIKRTRSDFRPSMIYQ